MTTLYEGAFAKINLTLDVLDKREDGYHDIKSVMQTIDPLIDTPTYMHTVNMARTRYEYNTCVYII